MKINIKNIYFFFLFLLLYFLCCDADNGRIIYLLTGSITILSLVKGGISRRDLLNDANIWNLVFLLLSTLTLLWTISVHDSFHMLINLMIRFLIVLSMTVFIKNRDDIEKTMNIYLVSLFFMMLKISMYIFQNGFTGPKMWDVICGNYFNTVAQFLAIGIAISLYFIYSKKSSHSIKSLYIFFIIFALWHIYITGSRKGMLMPLLELILFKFFDSKLELKKVFKLVFGLCAVSIIIYIILSSNNALYYRFASLMNMFKDTGTADESVLLRLKYIDLAKEMFYSSPLLGKGINTFAYVLNNNMGVYRYCHNNFYEILSGIGIVGFISYYWFYAKSLIKLYKNRLNNKLCLVGLSIFITLILFEYGIVTYSIYIYPIILSLVSLACNCNEDIEKKERTIDVQK